MATLPSLITPSRTEAFYFINRPPVPNILVPSVTVIVVGFIFPWKLTASPISLIAKEVGINEEGRKIQKETDP